MVQKIVTGFSKGMDKDTAFTKYDPNNYLDAENFRIIIDEEGKSGTLNTVKGNSLDFYVDDESIDGISGYCFIKDSLVLFGSGEQIFNIYYIPDITVILTSTTPYVITTPTVSFNTEDLVFRKAVGRYESSDTVKVYFLGTLSGETGNRMFVVNLENPPSYSPLLFKYCELVPEFKVSPIENIVETRGSIKTGTVQYAYQLYNPRGQESMFTTATSPLTVTTSQTSGYIKDYKGNPSNLPSGRGFNFDITIDSTPYSRIRVVRLFYETINTLPTPIIIYEGSISQGDTVNITDAGQSLGSYTMEEFRFISNIIFPKYLEEKNNYLFAANISQTTFDVEYDARAFRYIARVPPAVPLSYGSNYDPETTDTINPYNDLDNDGDSTKEYKYQINSLTELGGTGANVSYKFTTENILLDDLSNTTLVTGTGTGSYCDPLSPVGYQRDEIYRFGIVFFDYYGRSSFVKWIDDIRFPSIADYPLTEVVDGKLYGVALGIEFSVTNIPVSVYAYQIVRCNRDESNRTVIDCGICGHTEYESSGLRRFECGNVGTYSYKYPRLMDSTTYANSGEGANILEYISPEYNYNNKHILNSTKLYTWNYSGITDTVTGTIITVGNGSNNLVWLRKFYTYKGTFKNTYDIDSTVSMIQNTDSSTIEDSVDSINIRHRVWGTIDDIDISGTKGSTMLIVLSDPIYAGPVPIGPVYSYRRVNSNPYGGQSYGARQNSSYYPCGNLVSRTNTDFNTSNYIEVFSGDTYVTMFEYNRGIMLQKEASNYDAADIMHFPVESTINTNLKSNSTFNSMHDGSTSYATTPLFFSMQEQPGVYYANDDKTNLYTQTYSLYTYNSVYSQQDISKVYLMKPSDFNIDTSQELLITSSEQKSDGETTDSWTKFKFNNKINVTSKFGAVTGLINWRNMLIYTQPDGYGILSVEDREIQPSSNIGGYVLGTGGVLTRFDYIATDIGVKESLYGGNVNLLATANALYLYDSDRRKIFRYNGQHEVISDNHGLISYLTTLSTSDPNFYVGYNRKYQEVYFSNYYLDSTLVFSELTDSFVSRYTFCNNMFLNYKNNTWTVKNNSTTYLPEFYLHDTGTAYNTFYGVYSPSTITILVNPQGVVPVRWDMIQFNTNSSVAQQSFTSVQFDNSYQTSGSIPLIYEAADEETANFRRRFRPWRYNTIFDNDAYQNRFKDNYLKCKLTFTDPVTAKTTSLQVGEIITGYTQLPLH